MKNFTFNKENHYYELDGKRMYGVTTILQMIAKPALIPWAVKMAVDYIKNNCKQNQLIKYLVHLADLDAAKSAHRKKKEDAGAKGTDAHELIEGFILDGIDNNKGKIFGQSDNEQVNHFISWATRNDIVFLASEKRLYSESMWVAGTTDMVFIKDGKKYVGDIKTSSAIYPEHFYQMAAYRMMLEEMGENGFDGSVVIRIGKDGKFNKEKNILYYFFFSCDGLFGRI